MHVDMHLKLAESQKISGPDSELQSLQAIE
jgi:hypothetical protein